MKQLLPAQPISRFFSPLNCLDSGPGEGIIHDGLRAVPVCWSLLFRPGACLSISLS